MGLGGFGLGCCCEGEEPPPTTGACCIDNYCFITTFATCTAYGGDFQGLGTNCITTDCRDPDLMGRCCSGENYDTCSVTTVDDCLELGGHWFLGLSCPNGNADCEIDLCGCPTQLPRDITVDLGAGGWTDGLCDACDEVKGEFVLSYCENPYSCYWEYISGFLCSFVDPCLYDALCNNLTFRGLDLLRLRIYCNLFCNGEPPNLTYTVYMDLMLEMYFVSEDGHVYDWKAATGASYYGFNLVMNESGAIAVPKVADDNGSACDFACYCMSREQPVCASGSLPSFAFIYL
jgi:hypothetical protein